MFGTLRDLGRLMRASRHLRHASRLEARGHHEAAAEGYAGVIRHLDALRRLPAEGSEYSIRDILHLSIRLPATGKLARLRLVFGDRREGGRLAQEVLDLSARAPRTAEMVKWAEWARGLVRDSGA